MTHEERIQKTIAKIKVMQGYVDGRKIVSRSDLDGDFIKDDTPCWDWFEDDFRLAPELRPWTREECPMGEAVICSDDGIEQQISGRDSTRCHLSGFGWVLYENILKLYTMLDGSPCGVEEVEPF